MYLRELFNKYLRWSRSRAKVTVTAPAPAKYPGSETLAPPVYFISFFGVRYSRKNSDLKYPTVTSTSINSTFDINMYKKHSNTIVLPSRLQDKNFQYICSFTIVTLS